MEERIDFEGKLEHVETFEEAKVWLRQVGEDAEQKNLNDIKALKFHETFLALGGVCAVGLTSIAGSSPESFLPGLVVASIAMGKIINDNATLMKQLKLGLEESRKFKDLSKFSGMTEEEIIDFVNENVDWHNKELEKKQNKLGG